MRLLHQAVICHVATVLLTESLYHKKQHPSTLFCHIRFSHHQLTCLALMHTRGRHANTTQKASGKMVDSNPRPRANHCRPVHIQTSKNEKNIPPDPSLTNLTFVLRCQHVFRVSGPVRRGGLNSASSVDTGDILTWQKSRQEAKKNPSTDQMDGGSIPDSGQIPKCP